MQVSSILGYQQVSLEPEHELRLWEHLLKRSTIPIDQYPVQLSRLTDREKLFGSCSDECQNMIMAPFSRKHPDCTGIRFAFSGFLAEIFVPAKPGHYSTEDFMIKANSDKYFASNLDIADDVQIITFLANAHKKV